MARSHVSDSDGWKNVFCATLGFVQVSPFEALKNRLEAHETADSTHLKPPILGFSRLRHLEYALTLPHQIIAGCVLKW